MGGWPLDVLLKMKPSTIDTLLAGADDFMKGSQLLASVDDIANTEKIIGSIHPHFLPYLTRVGFETIGAEYIDRIPELIENFPKVEPYQSSEAEGKMPECFVFHWDGCGNPVGISHADNKVYVDDDVFGIGMELAETIDEYFIGLLSQSEED